MYNKPTDVQSVRLVEEYPVLRIINAEGPASKATMLALAKMQGRPLYGKAYIAYLEGAEAYFKEIRHLTADQALDYRRVRIALRR